MALASIWRFERAILLGIQQFVVVADHWSNTLVFAGNPAGDITLIEFGKTAFTWPAG